MKVSSCVLMVGAVLIPVLVEAGSFFDSVKEIATSENSNEVDIVKKHGRGRRSLDTDFEEENPAVSEIPVVPQNPVVNNIPYAYNYMQNSQNPAQSTYQQAPVPNTYQQAPVPNTFQQAPAQSSFYQQPSAQSYPYGNVGQSIQPLVPIPTPSLFQRTVILPIKRALGLVVGFFELILNTFMALNLTGIAIPWLDYSWTVFCWIVYKIADGIDDIIGLPLRIPGISILYRPIYYLIHIVIRVIAGVIYYPWKFLIHEVINLIVLMVHLIGRVVTFIWHIPFDIVLFFVHGLLAIF